ncbi:MAG: hypothetical protein H8E40_09105 [Chloroflexi bacterium]|nr:hypothetical protein [Chloroflexota bacterium]
MTSKNVPNEVVILEKIEGHLKEIKEEVLAKTPTLNDLEAHLTRQDKELKKAAEMGSWLTFLVFSGSVAFLGCGLLVGSKTWHGITAWDYLVVITVGIVGVCLAINKMRKIDRTSTSELKK